MKKARKLSDVQAERQAREAEQAARQRARESRAKVRAVATGRDPVQAVERLPMPVSSITPGKRPACYTDPIGRKRFTPARFLSDCCEESRDLITKAWKRGDQLAARRVPVDALPCVVIMAGYLRLYGAALVDDFDALIERYKDQVKECAHPDKFFASCIWVLHQRFLQPDEEAFESINVPAIYEELF